VPQTFYEIIIKWISGIFLFGKNHFKSMKRMPGQKALSTSNLKLHVKREKGFIVYSKGVMNYAE
jgi:hypothetical protein